MLDDLRENGLKIFDFFSNRNIDIADVFGSNTWILPLEVEIL